MKYIITGFENSTQVQRVVDKLGEDWLKTLDTQSNFGLCEQECFRFAETCLDGLKDSNVSTMVLASEPTGITKGTYWHNEQDFPIGTTLKSGFKIVSAKDFPNLICDT